MTSRRPCTEELLRAARTGDVEAWNHLDERYREALARSLRGRIPLTARRRFDTDDMLQSALLSAFTELDHFEYRGEGSFEHWVRRLVMNRMHGRLREHFAAKRDARLDEDLEGVKATPPARLAAESPSQSFTSAETVARLVRAIADLPELERKLIQLVAFERKPVDAIAHELGLSPRQVRRHRRRALESVRRRVGELEHERVEES